MEWPFANFLQNQKSQTLTMFHPLSSLSELDPKQNHAVVISLARAHGDGHTSLVYGLRIVFDFQKGSARVLGNPFRLRIEGGCYIWPNKELRDKDIDVGSIISYQYKRRDESRRYSATTEKKLKSSDVLSLLNFKANGGVVYHGIKEAFPNAVIAEKRWMYQETRPSPPCALISISSAATQDGRIWCLTRLDEVVNLSNNSICHTPNSIKLFSLPVQTPSSEEDVGDVLLVGFWSKPTRFGTYQADCEGVVLLSPDHARATIPDTPTLKRYDTSRDPRGLCILINNLAFKDEAKNRNGGEFDEEKLFSLFTDLSFKVEVKNDLKYNEIMDTAEEYAKEDHTDFDAFVMIVMTHGGNGDTIYGVNGKPISVKALMAEFKVDRCPSLKDKPKIFIFQTCRRSLNNNMVPASGSNKRFKPDALSPDSTLSLSVTPPEADFLLAFSTAPGYFSMRDSESGSLYIQVLVEVIRELHKHCHLLDMLTEVNRRVAVRAGNEIDSEDIQIPAPVYTLRAQLYL